MSRFGNFHPVTCAGWVFLALALASGGSTASGAESAAQSLQRADAMKSSRNGEFQDLVDELGKDPSRLSVEERLKLRYLVAWQKVYEGRYEEAIPQLNEVIEATRDETLKFRAGVTVVNALAIATRYQEGYTRLSQLLDQLPRVTDREAREQGMVVAAILYNLAGQYDLGLSYADRLLKEGPSKSAACKGGQLRLEALYRSGRLRTVGTEFDSVIDACTRLGEHIYANVVRSTVARLHLAEGRLDEAIGLLSGSYPEAQGTQYSRLISEFDSLLAEAHLRKGELAQAQRFALRAVNAGIKGEVTRSLADGYGVLYQLAKRRGDHTAALDFHERYAAADKGYLTGESAKAMAFQVVHQQVQEKKQQIDSLSKRNEVLQLEQKVSKAAAQARGLYILLLLSVLALIAMWAGMTKRSQLHFMKLARRDGLTGIFNRAHFADAAESILEYCRKGGREACVVLIDLDHFKRVNDKHGHAAGDAVLRRTVQACQAHLRSIDIIGRLGGEEFGIVLPDCDPEHARELAEQFRLAIADMSTGEGGVGFPVTASFGVTSSRWSSYNLKQLIIHADKALYVAKHHGRNRVEMFDPSSVAPAEAASPQAGSFDRRRA